MKRPVEFWATVALAGVIVYMIHDAYGSKHTSQEEIHIEEIHVEDPRDTAFEPAGVYTEWQSSIQPHQASVCVRSDWPCMKAEGCA